MKTNNSLTKLIAIALAVGIFAAVWSFSGTSLAQTQERQSERPRSFIAPFGFVGLTFGQTVRLNVVNIYPPDPVAPFDVAAVIVDVEGNVLARGKTRLEPGKSMSLEVNADKVLQFGNRLEVRALVRIKNEVEGINPCMVVSSMEVINNDTAATSLFINPAELVGFNPQPEPPASNFGQ